MSHKNIVVITGEASGDAHAARMITELKKLAPDTVIRGIGGDNMRAAGAEIDVDFSELAVMGLIEVLKRYRHIKKIFNNMVDLLKVERPDLLVLVDYPGFNLKLAKEAKKLGIPVLYYISPKVWAWRAGRVKTIKRVVDHMAVLFPFEVPIYESAGVSVSCVGHPLVDAVKRTLTIDQAKTHFGLNPQHRILGLFPGSRRSEVEALLPIMIQAAEQVCRHHYDVSVVLPMAPGLDADVIKPILAQSTLPIRVVDKDFYELTSACDAVVAASGTVTLEIALLGVPHFIIYRVAPMTYRILSRLVKIPYVGLCNIVTDKALVLELLQDDVSVERLEAEMTALLINPKSKDNAEAIRQQVLTALGPSGGAHNAAQQVINMLKLPNND
ncbi:MAG: lipid-A-disaccharide synthase [Gammaproteobacteria bacterium]|nr:lipid-A-disaccharide synthase [Gammaproteobacteria bacterium]MDH5592003.1 lipid-A-disaccharide synthase [Gammaproteobacteria bacterium]